MSFSKIAIAGTGLRCRAFFRLHGPEFSLFSVTIIEGRDGYSCLLLVRIWASKGNGQLERVFTEIERYALL